MTAIAAPVPAEYSIEPSPRESQWAVIATTAPALAETMSRYLDQIAVSLRPATVSAGEVMLRRFAGFLTTNYPEIVGLVDVERRHIEAFKRYLPTLPGSSGRPPLADTTIRMTLGTLRTFFERVSEWGYPDAPTKVLIFNGDLPTPDAPLPKFLSDPDASKLMRAAGDADPVDRMVIEMLARTGLRVGELCALTADAVVFINSRHWLKVPVGKLHNDRYIPLHPQLVELLNDHLGSRNDDIDRLIIRNASSLNRHQITRIVSRIAKVAGIGHVHPHQLRHTLATQAINRGMSLEAIAALLGHKTLRMTLVYARIADRTVADAYDKVTDQVDALYNKPTGLRTTDPLAWLASPPNTTNACSATDGANDPLPSTANTRPSVKPVPTTPPTRPSTPSSLRNATTQPTVNSITASTSSKCSSTATNKPSRDPRLPLYPENA